MLWPRPLRMKISLLLVALLSFGLLASSFIATTSLSDYLIGRVDERLTGDVRLAAGAGMTASLQSGSAVASSSPGGSSASASARTRPPSRLYIAMVPADGSATQVLATVDDAGAPALPSVAELATDAGEPVTIGPAEFGGEWRMLVTRQAGEDAWIVVATPLADVQATVGRLVQLQVIIGLLVVLAVGILGYWIVRRSLRPLEEISAVTASIADGDLSARVPESGHDAEVDVLARSFNAMVTSLETAFASQQASEAQARASEQRVRQFVADASHELRTPLTSIRGYAELIDQGAAAEDGSAVRRIQDEASRMGTMVEDMLVLARLDLRPPMKSGAVDMAAIAVASVSGFQAGLPERRLQVSVPEAGEVVVKGDEGRLRQVADNLVSNALRYSPDDSVVVVRVERESADCVLSVSDEGIGLSAQEIDRVFERLYRTDDARTRVRGGTGLGLAIVKSVVGMHGGSVSVVSEQGLGSRFIVRLPRL